MCVFVYWIQLSIVQEHVGRSSSEHVARMETVAHCRREGKRREGIYGVYTDTENTLAK